MSGPDVGGSMGGHDPEKFGPIRSILKHYAKSPHPFTQCVRDNKKRFGPRTNQICAWVKDQIRGTTHWRGKESAFAEAMRQEGVPQNQIAQFLFDFDIDTLDNNFYPTAVEAQQYADAAGIDYDPNGYDKQCPVCESMLECKCDVDWDMIHREHGAANLKRMYTLVEAKTDNKTPSEVHDPVNNPKTDNSKNDISLDSDKATIVAESKNGTSVYSDGSIVDHHTNIRKHPVQVYFDGSVRYDDGTVAKPNSIAALSVVGGLSKEQRANLFSSGTGGVPVAEFASIDSVIKQALAKTFADSGVGGAGELRTDQVAAAGAVGAGVPSPVAAQPSLTLPTRGAPGSTQDNNQPVQLQRGERVTQGPQGGRGVWRSIDGHPVFVKLGQSTADARKQQSNKKSGRS